MVVKVTSSQLAELMDGIHVPMTSAYFTGSWVEQFTEGKIALSVKRGKRRKMMKGRMVCQGYLSSQSSSGHLVLRLMPNNLTKAQNLCQPLLARLIATKPVKLITTKPPLDGCVILSPVCDGIHPVFQQTFQRRVRVEPDKRTP